MKTTSVNNREQNAEKTATSESKDLTGVSGTLHLLGSSANNAKRLESSIAQLKLGNVLTKELPMS